jgi:1-phosphatidylinositol phosphodiesterase
MESAFMKSLIVYTIAFTAFLLVATESGVAADYANWMGLLDGKKRLSEFTIPGTHDSGALHEAKGPFGPITGTATCQAIPIASQLNIGVRFLDIRCVIHDGGFEIYHGSVDQQVSFDSVLDDCVSFLKSHKGETIIMSVKKEHAQDDNKTFEAIFDSYISRNTNAWLLNDTLPTLDESRGKIVLFRRFDVSKLPKGIAAAPGDWKDSQSFQIKGPVEIHVQDKYELDNKTEKWPAVQELLLEAFAGKPDVLYLDFTSGYVRKTIFNIPDIREVEHAVTPSLATYFENAPPGRYGVIILDFADSSKCAKIIAVNE